MTIKELTEKRAELKNKMSELVRAADTENRAINAEESELFGKYEQQIKDIDGTIDAKKKIEGLTEVRAAENGEEKRFVDYIFSPTEVRAGEQNLTMSGNGAVIPLTVSKKIIDSVEERCPIFAGADRYNVKGTLRIPKWTKSNGHDVNFALADEFTEITADSGKFESAELGGYLAGGLVLIGDSLINNGDVNVSAFISKKIADKASGFIENMLLNGTGTQQPQGAMNTTNSVTAASATALTFAELVKLQSSIKQANQRNSCWTMHPTTFTAIKLLTDTNGRSLIQPDGSKEFPFTLLGKPVYLSDNMPTISAGAKAVLYGDYSGLSVNVRENISVQVLREKYATQHAIGLIAWLEIDSKITDENRLAVLKMKAS